MCAEIHGDFQERKRCQPRWHARFKADISALDCLLRCIAPAEARKVAAEQAPAVYLCAGGSAVQ